MRNKRVLSTSITAMLVISMLAMLAPSVSASPTPILYFDPDPKALASSTPCYYNNTYFTLQVKINETTMDLTGVDIRFTYNQTLLQYTNYTVDGPNQVFPAPGNGTRYFTDSSVPGDCYLSLVMGQTPVLLFDAYANQTVVWITFKVVFCPEQIIGLPITDNEVNCTLDWDEGVTGTFIYGAGGSVITSGPHDNGFYSYTTYGVSAPTPTAHIVVSPSYVYVCDTVTLDGTTSTPGTGAYITTWLWNITGPAGSFNLVGPLDQDTTYFHCNGTGTVHVTLTVTNNYSQSDDDSVDIEQHLLLGAVIDLYTSQNRFCGQITDPDNVGKGIDQPCDALTDDVNVTLFAKVTWGGAPVMHVLVAFEVWWDVAIDWQHQDQQPVPKNQCVLYRTAETDKDGIAQIWFRVPTPCPGRMHGKWMAIVKAKIQDDPIMDTMPFDVGWLLTLTESPEGLTLDRSTYIREVDCVCFNVTVKSISWIPKHLTLIAVIYDDCDVPIGQWVINTVIDPGAYCSPNHELIVVYCHLPVPQWAYVGQGKIYVSAFTALPRDCGIPYCPEVSRTFSIVYVP